MRTFGLALLWFFVGLIVTWVAVVAVGVGWMTLTGYIDREGAGSMGLIFMIGPFFGIIGGISATIWSIRRSRSRSAT